MQHTTGTSNRCGLWTGEWGGTFLALGWVKEPTVGPPGAGSISAVLM